MGVRRPHASQDTQAYCRECCIAAAALPLQGGRASPSRRRSSPQSRGALARAEVLHADVLRRAGIPQRARHSCGCPTQRRLQQEEEEEEETALERSSERGLVKLQHAET